MRFREALGNPAVHAEAELRLGHVQLMQRRYDEALASWKRLSDAPGDPALIYLARLFSGLAYEGLRRDDDARAAYQSAAALSPSAHSVNMRVAVLAFRAGQVQESQQIIDRLLKDDDPRRDPWWSYLRSRLAFLVSADSARAGAAQVSKTLIPPPVTQRSLAEIAEDAELST